MAGYKKTVIVWAIVSSLVVNALPSAHAVQQGWSPDCGRKGQNHQSPGALNYRHPTFQLKRSTPDCSIFPPQQARPLVKLRRRCVVSYPFSADSLASA
jgi:hypothetical protein